MVGCARSHDSRRRRLLFLCVLRFFSMCDFSTALREVSVRDEAFLQSWHTELIGSIARSVLNRRHAFAQGVKKCDTVDNVGPWP